MFIGHFAIGLGAKRAAPDTSLATAFVACQLLDMIWPVLVLAGIEKVRVDHGATAFTPIDLAYFPWSHSLGMTVIWSAAMYGLLKVFRHTHREALTMACVVFSHWLLDVLTHRPDMPLWFGDTAKIGLGLWGSVAGTLVVELSLFGVGLWLYVRQTRAVDKQGAWGFWTMIGTLLLIYFASAFGPKPPLDAPAAAIAGPALGFWLFIAWAYWADKHRRRRS